MWKKITVQSREMLSVDKNLIFKAYEIRNLADNLVKEDVRVTWEISNVGMGEDEKHQEIYYIGKDGKRMFYTSEMKRNLLYKGTHMVRCTIVNNDRNKWITKVFVVEGLK